MTTLTKCAIAMRMLAYDIAVDCVYEYLKIGVSTVLESMKKFKSGIVEIFGEECLRKPNQADVDSYCKLLKPVIF